MSIADLPHAVLHEVSPNEIGFDQELNPDGTSSWDDPVKLRFGAAPPSDGRKHFYLGCIGADLLKNGSRGEKIFIAFKMDNNDGLPPLPCIEIYAQRNEHTDSDADMLCILRISSKGLELDPKGVGGMGITGVNSSPKDVNRMWSPDGLKFTQQQNDGNFVTYEVDVPFDIGANPIAKWSAWTGFIG